MGKNKQEQHRSPSSNDATSTTTTTITSPSTSPSTTTSYQRHLPLSPFLTFSGNMFESCRMIYKCCLEVLVSWRGIGNNGGDGEFVSSLVAPELYPSFPFLFETGARRRYLLKRK